MWIDSHCHVTADEFAEDRSDVLARAAAAGVDVFIAIGSGYGVARNGRAVELARADERAVLAESLEDDIDEIEHGSGGALRFQRQSVGRRTMRKLARGGYSVQDELDLHGMTLAEAKPRLADFIDYSATQGKLCVRVVHGKGIGSGERGPVLKNAVNRWLRNWDCVLAFVSTRQVDGGTGAIYVLLQRD